MVIHGNRAVLNDAISDTNFLKNVKEVYIDNINSSSMMSMFNGATNLQKAVITKSNDRSITHFRNMFNGCTSLTDIQINCVNHGTDFRNMFSFCRNLKNAPEMEFVNSAGVHAVFSNMFQSCDLLENVPIYNFISALDSGGLDNIFLYCPKLTDESLQNILKSLKTAIQYRGTKTLQKIGLTQAQSNICITFPEWAELEARGWTTGY